MKYCANETCRKQDWCDNADVVCGRCQTELTPCIQCLCGEGEYNPRFPDVSCQKCGTQWTKDYLGQCMSVQLKEMVKNIAHRYSVQNN